MPPVEANGVLNRIRFYLFVAAAVVVYHTWNQQVLVGTRPQDESSKELILPKTASSTNTTNTATVSHAPMEVLEVHENRTRFAYAYVVGGVDPDKPNYRFYLYDIAISTYLQRREGSSADVVLLIQMSFASSYTKLPDSDRRLLDQFSIHVQYIPKAEDESFYRTMLDKFRILSLTHYDRVLFMDADVMAFGNLDYLFELSVEGVLKDNVVVAGYSEPANGGFFMLAPRESSMDEVLGIIQEKEARGASLPYPHFDKEIGWGHAFANDSWKLITGRKSTLWDFHGSFADQGLLYYWVMYHEMSVSVIEKRSVYNWARNETTNEVYLESELDLSKLEHRASPRTCWRIMRGKACLPPHRDYFHFTGTKKPWLKGPAANWRDANATVNNLWFHTLDLLNTKYELKLNFSDWKLNKRPLLGLYPKNKDVVRTNYSGTFDTLKSRR